MGGSTTAIRRGKAVRASALAALVLVLSARTAGAGFLPDFLGNSQPTVGGTVFIVNFAVLDQAGGSAGNTWNADPTNQLGFDARFRAGTGSPALDTTAKYLFLYQVANDSNLQGPSLVSHTLSLPIDLNSGAITSFGIFGGLGLADDGGLVNADNAFGRDRANREDPAPINLGVKDPSVMLTGGAGQNPSTSLTRVSATMGRFDAAWPGIRPTQFSSIYGFTTNLAPWTGMPKDTGARGSDGSFPIGHVVTVIPEPSSLLLLGLGLGIGLGVRLKRTPRPGRRPPPGRTVAYGG